MMIVLGAGFFGTQMFWAFHSASMPLFLKDFTESKFEISLVLSLAGVMGCIAPPIIGHFSDRTWTRFGRRKPYAFVLS
jgi:maltose/moltooligosaccharide transporter